MPGTRAYKTQLALSGLNILSATAPPPQNINYARLPRQNQPTQISSN